MAEPNFTASKNKKGKALFCNFDFHFAYRRIFPNSSYSRDTSLLSSHLHETHGCTFDIWTRSSLNNHHTSIDILAVRFPRRKKRPRPPQRRRYGDASLMRCLHVFYFITSYFIWDHVEWSWMTSSYLVYVSSPNSEIIWEPDKAEWKKERSRSYHNTLLWVDLRNLKVMCTLTMTPVKQHGCVVSTMLDSVSADLSCPNTITSTAF